MQLNPSNVISTLSAKISKITGEECYFNVIRSELNQDSLYALIFKGFNSDNTKYNSHVLELVARYVISAEFTEVDGYTDILNICDRLKQSININGFSIDSFSANTGYRDNNKYEVSVNLTISF